MSTKKYKRYIGLLILFTLAFALKYIYIDSLNRDPVISSDAQLYASMAESFLKGDGLVNTVRDRDYVVGPIFPLLMAVVFGIFGIGNFKALLLIHYAISAASAVLTYILGEKLFGKRYGWVFYVLFLLYTPFTYWTHWMITETTYIFMLILLLYLMVSYERTITQPAELLEHKLHSDTRLKKKLQNAKVFFMDKLKPHESITKVMNALSKVSLKVKGFFNVTYWHEKKAMRYVALIGLVLGLANLVRPLLLLFAPVLMLWIWYVNGWKLKRTLQDVIVAGLIMIIVMSPWVIRNFVRYQEIILVTNYGAQELYSGNNPHTVTDIPFSFELPTYDPVVLERILKLPVLEQEKAFSHEAKEYILADPLGFVTRTLEKAKNLFWKPLGSWDGRVYHIVGWELDRYFIILGIVGAFFSIFSFKKYSSINMLILYYSAAVSAITVVHGARYRLPIMVAVVILCSLVFVTLLKGIVASFCYIRHKLRKGES